MTRSPCPHCGTLYVTLRYFHGDGEEARDILDHDCLAFAPVEPLTEELTDTTFLKEAWNSQDGLDRRSLR